MDKIAVYCGANSGNNPVYIEQAKSLGKLLASQGKTVVYGGAEVGCMGAVADAALEHGGEVIGVIPKSLQDVEIAHSHLTTLHIVDSMHERKDKMAQLADGFIALPGGVGTFEEWFEVFTWAQLGYHEKPCALLNVNHFYDPLIHMLEHTIEEGFMKERYRDLILISNDPIDLLQKMESYEPTHTVRWK